ncbi:hypothetical protein M422DRAFT_51568 [Sphaerobolus stellatus SS14]|uniref:Uncharacterized protein n=1 Tax=Sphaerobolus stellatus (strain SS14) TaxID=990650 RepID=A0A0C9UKB5_SPHS4|nr:hypothetical protein M422DRAFT_51568 [Sphaerobolus stellatus SS14]
MPSTSALHPIDPSSAHAENEKEATWIARKLAGSMTGRIIMSGYESLRATGTSVICLSPWGDSSPLLLPCIRFRDLAVHMVIAATGGTAAIAAPVMAPFGDVIITTLGDSILVELGLHAGFKLAVEGTNEIFIDNPIHHVMKSNDKRLITTAVKQLTITLKYKHTMTDASLGFFRSSIHKDVSLFSTVKDYLAIEKGWFSPYLFASGRRPVIPRTMTPDVVFCHGPFLSGDYRIGETLMNESATIIILCEPSASSTGSSLAVTQPEKSRSHLRLPSFSGMVEKTQANLSKLSLSRSPSPTPQLSPSLPAESTSLPDKPAAVEPGSAASESDTAIPVAAVHPRRMVILVLGIQPHRRLWMTSARPSESVIQYTLLNGCPAIVLPVKPGSPLIAWDSLTLAELHKIGKEGGTESAQAKGIVDVLFEYVGLCVDWQRVIEPRDDDEEKTTVPLEVEMKTVGDSEPEAKREGDEGITEGKKTAVKEAIGLLVAGAINSKESKEAKKEIDLDRAGIVMFRIP